MEIEEDIIMIDNEINDKKGNLKSNINLFKIKSLVNIKMIFSFLKEWKRSRI